MWDSYGRLLAYGAVEPGISLADGLISMGYASVTRGFDFRRKTLYLLAEERAKAGKYGMWSNSISIAEKTEESISRADESLGFK